MTVRLSSEDLAGQDPSAIQHPQPIILDSGLRFPINAKLLLPTSPTRPWIFTRREHDTEKKKQLEALGAKVFIVDQDAEGRDRLFFREWMFVNTVLTMLYLIHFFPLRH